MLWNHFDLGIVPLITGDLSLHMSWISEALALSVKAKNCIYKASSSQDNLERLTYSSSFQSDRVFKKVAILYHSTIRYKLFFAFFFDIRPWTLALHMIAPIDDFLGILICAVYKFGCVTFYCTVDLIGEWSEKVELRNWISCLYFFLLPKLLSLCINGFLAHLFCLGC